MGQRQNHRGRHPEDTLLFGPKCVPALREAVADLSYLLSRGYAEDAALKIVGDHYQSHLRQRRAILRAACGDISLERRHAAQVPLDALRGAPVVLDGYNVLIAVESILAGGVLLRGRDGCLRDMASVHGSYRKVEETEPAIAAVGEALADLGVANAHWLFDAPVSNSGRLKTLMRETAEVRGWTWNIELANNVDRRVAETTEIAVTSDGWILDRARRWANLTLYLVSRFNARALVVELG